MGLWWGEHVCCVCTWDASEQRDFKIRVGIQLKFRNIWTNGKQVGFSANKDDPRRRCQAKLKMIRELSFQCNMLVNATAIRQLLVREIAVRVSLLVACLHASGWAHLGFRLLTTHFLPITASPPRLAQGIHLSCPSECNAPYRWISALRGGGGRGLLSGLLGFKLLLCSALFRLFPFITHITQRHISDNPEP